MKIASWNVNSIKVRRERLLAWLVRHKPDVLCLQELKAADEGFPRDDVYELGYQAVLAGQKTYNGVAILSRTELSDVRIGLDDGVEDAEARLVSASIQGVRVICVYVPNGQEVSSTKWPYKLAWLERLQRYLATHHRPDEPLVLCGDFNIAPEDVDCHAPEEWRESVLCHEQVRERYRQLVAWGLTDTFRILEQSPGKYSWWDYRMLAFPKGRGLRIDLLLATTPVAGRVSEVGIDREERKGKQPSDHAPVFLTLKA
jgi:exodeoxyribonuclease-3